MANKHDLQLWVLDAITAHGGAASVLDVSKWIWSTYGEDLASSGDLFYTWQYDMRWAAHVLRASGELAPSAGSKGQWRLQR